LNLSDTHCHLDLNRFDDDRDEVIARAQEAGLTRILIPGITLASSRAAVKLANSHPMLFAAVGVHPNDALTWDEAARGNLRNLAQSPRVNAIGEIGLDYYRDHAPHDLQRRILKEQLSLAAELGLPVVLHLREEDDADSGLAAADLLEMLEAWVADLKSRNDPLAERPGVLHSFGGTLETAQQAIRLGFYIGVTGPVTFKNAAKRQQVVAALPLERLLTETDAPFLAPHPHRGKRNEPAYVHLVAEKIAELHTLAAARAAEITSANAARLFNW